MHKAVANELIDGGAGTIRLAGKVFLVGQPTPEDLASIGAYLKKRAKSPVAALQDDPDFALLSAEDQKARLAEAAKRKFDSQLPFDPMSALDALTSLEGTRFTAWTLIRKKQPEVTFEEITRLVTEENHLQVSVELDIASGMEKLGNSAGRPGSATAG